MPQPETDPYADLRDRIAETRRAAERLAGEVPRQGWATPRQAQSSHDEAATLVALLQALRELVPDELREQVNEVLRQLLLLLRAVVDHLVARLEAPDEVARAAEAREPQDIPIA